MSPQPTDPAPTDPEPANDSPAARTPFADLDDYLKLGRVEGLALSPDGGRLVVGVSVLDEKATARVTSLWEVDPDGERPARRLTWGAKSETAPAFLPDGSLIFTSARPDPDAAGDDDEPPTSLWLLPADGGEARPLAARPGGVGAVAVARDSAAFVVASRTLPAATSAEQDAERRKARKDRKVTAVLHDSYPIRYWDEELGPDRDRLFLGSVDGAGTADRQDRPDPGTDKVELEDLTGHVGGAIGSESSWDLSPDARQVAVAWMVPEAGGSSRNAVRIVETASRQGRTVLDDVEHDYYTPVFSPDGTKLAVTAERRPRPDAPIDQRLLVVHLDTGATHDAAPFWDRWPAGPATWTPDGSALLVVADDAGRSPVWRIDLDSREATRLTGDDGAYTSLQLSRDGGALYALRSDVGSPPAPVRLDPKAADQQPQYLPGPVPPPAVPGTLSEVHAEAEDGTGLRAWLALPAGASTGAPAPLLVWVHGGPLGSWNAWSWRWNPWLAVARGYAVLLPDPALSTGYGLAAIERGWGRWGFESYTDVMALTDAAVDRDDVDAERTAALGGSYGGYMANWIAGHTDRFRGIVSHAGLWALDQFGPTTDVSYYWRREMSGETAAANSPHRFVDDIRTPMLVIHGDRDYRVPIGEALRLWSDLAERGTAPDGSLPHRLLVFPDENHWILKPQHAKLWYETVFAFLAHTVHGDPWRPSELLT